MKSSHAITIAILSLIYGIYFDVFGARFLAACVFCYALGIEDGKSQTKKKKEG